MSKYKSKKLSWGITLLSALFVLGATTMSAMAQLPEFDWALHSVPQMQDDATQAFPGGDPVHFEIADLELVYPGFNVTFHRLLSAQFGAASIVGGNRVRWTPGANVLDVFGSASATGFDAEDLALVRYQVRNDDPPGDIASVYARIRFPAASFPTDSLQPPVVTDFPFREDGKIVDEDLEEYYVADSFGWIFLDTVFKRNYRNVEAAWNNNLGSGFSWFDPDNILEPVGIPVGEDYDFAVTDKDGNDASELLVARYNSLVGPFIAALPVDADGDPLNPFDPDLRQEWVDATLAIYAAQPFSASYSVQDALGDNQDVVEGNVEFAFIRGGNVFKPYIMRVIPNVDGEEVELNPADLLLNPADLPDDWDITINVVPAGALPGLPYPYVSGWDQPGNDAALVQVDVVDNVVTYTHEVAADANTYFYLVVQAEDAGGIPVGAAYYAQVRIALLPEDDTSLPEAAIDLEYTTAPRQAVFNIPFVNDVIAGDERVGVTSEDADDATVRTANWGFDIYVVNGEAEGVYEADPELVRILTGGNELAPAIPESQVLVDGVLVDTAFYDEDDLLIITDQGGVVRYDGDRFVYTPPRGFTGVDSFEYTISDGTYLDAATLNTASATITITVPEADEWTVVNTEAPDDIERLIEVGTSSGVIALGANRYKEVSTAPANGSVAWQRQVVQDAVGILAGNFIYTPNAGWTGTDTFQFRIFRAGPNVWSDLATARFVVTSGAGVDEEERRPTIMFGPVLSQNINATWMQVWVGKDGAAYHSEWLAPTTQWFADGAGGWEVRQEPRRQWNPIAHLPGGSYAFWVRPWGPQMGYGAWYLVREYDLMSRAPEIVTLVAPVDGVYVDDPRVDYRWTHDRDATWYRIWIERDGATMVDWWIDMGPGVVDAPTIQRQIAGHVIGHDYEWWIRPWGPDGFGPWSEPGDFTRIVPVDDDNDDDDNDDDDNDNDD